LYKILVIDDDPSGTELLITLLGLEGFQGSRLEDWTDPLADVKRHHPDLVIMDVYLSGWDGVELLSAIRAHPEPRIANTPVLMMSAEDLESRCVSAGANAFVGKPFDLKKLMVTIREITEVDLLED
jgi:DNA-binding response OmpR family regulator